MAEERTYIIPLRKEFLKAPKYKRTKRAVSAVRSFVKRHMKAEDVKIGEKLNLEIWKHGGKNPPSKIKVHTIKEDNIARVELIDVPFKKPEEKKKGKEKSEEKKETLEKQVETKLTEEKPKEAKKAEEKIKAKEEKKKD